MRRSCAEHEVQDADESCVFMYTKTATTLVGVRVILTTENRSTPILVLFSMTTSKQRKETTLNLSSTSMHGVANDQNMYGVV